METITFMLLSCLTAYLVCQFIKVLANKDGKSRNVKAFFIKKGGVISSHSAVMVALLVAIYLTEGITTAFIITLIFTLVIISELLKDKETGRHSFREILLGTILGELITISYFIYFLL